MAFAGTAVENMGAGITAVSEGALHRRVQARASRSGRWPLSSAVCHTWRKMAVTDTLRAFLPFWGSSRSRSLQLLLGHDMLKLWRLCPIRLLLGMGGGTVEYPERASIWTRLAALACPV